MDTRWLCAACPFRGQANLTRSWCNGVALCRTSSSQQGLSPVVDVYVGHAAQKPSAPPGHRVSAAGPTRGGRGGGGLRRSGTRRGLARRP